MKKPLTESAKKAIVEKALNRNPEQTLTEIATQNNIVCSTLSKWIRKYQENPGSTSTLSRSTQFEHLVATAHLEEAALGAYCRQHGLYSFQLVQWKKELLNPAVESKKVKDKVELNSLKIEHQRLKKDLLRKDRALAETTALLVLKKKADLLFGGPEDD